MYENFDSSTIWHCRLGHVNLDSVKRMMNLDLIPKHTIDKTKKCQVCITAK